MHRGDALRAFRPSEDHVRIGRSSREIFRVRHRRQQVPSDCRDPFRSTTRVCARSHDPRRLRSLEAVMNADIRDIARHFTALSAVVPLRPIRSERDYKSAVRSIDELLDAGGADESNVLADLVALIGEFIAEYEQRKGYVLPDATGVDALRFLMEQR